VRLFIAIDLPEEVKHGLFGLSTELIRQASSGRVIPLENYHITLVFIGETSESGFGGEEERLRIIKEVMSGVCLRKNLGSLPIKLGGIGSFRSYRGHNWWVGVEPNPDLAELADSLAEELRAKRFAIERRNFKPHITIGRSVVTKRPIALDAPLVELAAEKISLMRSDRKNDRQVYSEIFACSL
jgi:2'-5' RNA ligase